MGNNCKPQSLARRRFSGLPGPFGQGTHADSFSVARVRPRTSKGITDLLLLNLVRLEAACPSKKICLYVGSKTRRPKPGPSRYHKVRLFSRLESRSLSELTRQIAPPTKNGHAPPPTESRKSYQSVNPSGVWAW
ncbi:hypothetical protein PUN28_017928 [Cardiocondyla obscurior]|uniref:Uncharacterized protein n=1 Tax=Cardiocondyla obscurior TaxID=286306 RepID=A0AAW2ENQ1_9HYME